MLKVGITGGIGSGKSTITSLFHDLGVPIYNSDERAKWLLSNDVDLMDQIKILFGQESYSNNKLNRAHIANIVFQDNDMLKQLNAIVHPLVKIDFENWLLLQKKEPLVIKEAAILIESGAYKELDVLIVVLADKKTRIKRVINRDNVSKEEVEKRMETQISDSERLKFANFSVDNNTDQSNLKMQVGELYKQLLSYPKNK
ncbi:MAG: dephospho-CoA kinase [Bacteroidota bacterium]|jgi:dephospho-CoA kinase|nr:dephospho-CoA kinase [Bacteroidota bacterium]|tara:strand:- start:4085 stop:4684 length:600 start_codon:yes stop_codon:yes gene_type:complete